MELNINAVYRALSIADIYNPNNNESFEENFDALVNEIRVKYLSKHEMNVICQNVKYLYDARQRVMLVNRDVAEDPELETFVYRMITIRHRLGFHPNDGKYLYDGLDTYDGFKNPTPQDIYAYLAYLFVMVPFENFFDSLNDMGGMFAFDGTFNQTGFNHAVAVASEVYDIRPRDATNRFNLLVNYAAYLIYFKDKYDVGNLDTIGEDALSLIDLFERFPTFIAGIPTRKEADSMNCHKAIFDSRAPLGRAVMDIACLTGIAKKVTSSEAANFARTATVAPDVVTRKAPVSADGRKPFDGISFEGAADFPTVLKILTSGMEENFRRNGGHK